MIVSLSPSQDDILTALRTVLKQLLPPGNALFKGSISGTNMTVTEVTGGGPLAAGDQIFGQDASEGQVAVAADTFIQSQTSGTTGGPGVYVVTVSQAVSGLPLSAGVPVILAQANRVAEPSSPDFVLMTPVRADRLATNTDASVDSFFAGSVAGTVLTVTGIQYGKVNPGAQLFGPNVAANTIIRSQLSGPAGGNGTYRLSVSQTVSAQNFACGVTAMLQPTKVTIQLDVHGPKSWDYAQIISTALRDQYGVELFEELGPNITPLYADNPKQMPFLNGEAEYENRWVIMCELQADQTVVIPQQFADQLTVGLIEVDTTYP